MSTSRFIPTLCALLAVLMSMSLVLPAPAWAQAPKAPAGKAPVGKAAAAKDKPLPPEEVGFDTKDGWSIHATYYPGKLKKLAVPIIMLHGWEGTRGDYDSLALYMQSLGHAVLCPDLRGHGQSNVRPGSDKVIDDPNDLKRDDLEAMLRDVEACKKFLRQKNNEGELNIESLCLVAADFSAIVAMQWAVFDWSAASLASYKQGQDVKALVLLSPRQSYKGLTLQKALVHPAMKSQINLLIAAGQQDSRGHADARKMNTTMESFRPDMKKKDVKAEDRTLVLVEPDTNLSGTELLNEALRLKGVIGKFIEFRLVNKNDDYAWSERKSPLDN